MFARYGSVKAVSIHKDTAPDIDKNSERHIAFITYLEEGAAENAAEAVHNTRPFLSCGRVPLMVKLAEDFPQRGHHGNGANGSGNNQMRGNKPMRRDIGKPFRVPDGGCHNALTSSGGCAQFGKGTRTVTMTGGGSSHFFAPVAGGGGGFFLPSAMSGGVGMGVRAEQVYSLGAPVIWPPRAGTPVQFSNGTFATTTAEPLALNNAVPASYYHQPPISMIGSNAVPSLPVYTTQLLPLATNMNSQQVDGMGGGTVHVVDLAAVSSPVASGASPPGMLSYAAFMAGPPPTGVVSVADPITPITPVTPVTSEFHWAAEHKAPVLAGGISPGRSVFKPQQTSRGVMTTTKTVPAPAPDAFGSILFSGGLAPP